MIKSNNFLYIKELEPIPPNLTLIYNNSNINARYLNLRKDQVSVFIPPNTALYSIASTHAYIRGTYSPVPIETELDENLFVVFASNYNSLDEDDKNSILLSEGYNSEKPKICTCGVAAIMGDIELSMHSDWCDLKG